VVEIGRRRFQKWSRAIGPGVVHQNIQSGQIPDAGLHRCEIGDVERNSLRRAARQQNRLARRFDLTFGASRKDYFGPGGGETSRCREAEASACACHERALPVEAEGRRARKLGHFAASM
jgi:hypothetical protein